MNLALNMMINDNMAWISVKDRLPQNAGDVLVIGDGLDDECWWKICFWEHGRWYTQDAIVLSGKSQEHITHWIPLDEIPKP